MNPIYFDFFKTTSIEDIIINFLETLIKTNRTYNFFVNWDKIRKNIENFLCNSAFSSFETKDLIPTAIMGAEKGHPWIVDILEYYKDKRFVFDGIP